MSGGVTELVWLLAVAGLVAGAGLAVGILLIAPRLDRWADRDEEQGDRDG